ncbi:extracellular solute-binding protein [Cytobacillus sp. S13-E01]|uniref:sugar ABC transporter substrate-binding protein n=1 Tax=Cytobacillus sp. S13-E01 TaxID=3031326 RepID=UPI0023D8C32C|nr:extracellular solute-binding protein [Cytobacillus sp. S13-E01]MDF0726976.1 extracellular solute-binding protein [Cytobacillus sp. S13-E01]
MKKFLSMFMIMVLALGFLAACGPQRNAQEEPAEGGANEEATETDKPEKLTMWVNDEEKQKDAIAEMVKSFTEEYGIEVEMTPISMLDQVKNLALDAPAGKGPDVFFQPHDRIGDIVTQGLAEPVTLDNAGDYSETAIDAVTYDGEIYGVPQVVETYGLFYNKDLSPEAPSTMEELTALASSQTDAAQDKYGFLMEAANFYFVYPFFAGYGGYVFNKEGGAYDASDIGLANEGAVQGGELVQSWFTNGYIPKEITGDIMNGLFTGGKVAAVITGPWNIATYRDALGDKLATAPLPLLENGENPKSFVGVKSWMVSSYSENKEWATKLLQHITNQENSMYYYENAGEMPANQAALTDEKITNDPLMSGFAEQIAYGEPMPSIPQMQQVWDPMGSALQFIANGDDVKEVLEEAVQTIKDNIAASGAK